MRGGRFPAPGLPRTWGYASAGARCGRACPYAPSRGAQIHRGKASFHSLATRTDDHKRATVMLKYILNALNGVSERDGCCFHTLVGPLLDGRRAFGPVKPGPN